MLISLTAQGIFEAIKAGQSADVIATREDFDDEEARKLSNVLSNTRLNSSLEPEILDLYYQLLDAYVSYHCGDTSEED